MTEFEKWSLACSAVTALATVLAVGAAYIAHEKWKAEVHAKWRFTVGTELEGDLYHFWLLVSSESKLEGKHQLLGMSERIILNTMKLPRLGYSQKLFNQIREAHHQCVVDAAKHGHVCRETIPQLRNAIEALSEETDSKLWFSCSRPTGKDMRNII